MNQILILVFDTELMPHIPLRHDIVIDVMINKTMVRVLYSLIITVTDYLYSLIITVYTPLSCFIQYTLRLSLYSITQSDFI